jgi:hypothetical protein
VEEAAKGENERRSLEGSPTEPSKDGLVRTQTALLKRRKEELLEYNRKTFADIAKELPKFSDQEGNDKKWWTKRTDYNPNETTKSAKEFNLKKKKCFSGSVEPIVIADH